MRLYRARPITVEALEWTGDLNAMAEFIPLMWEHMDWSDIEEGDYVVKIGDGLVHFHTPKAFARLYSPLF